MPGPSWSFSSHVQNSVLSDSPKKQEGNSLCLQLSHVSMRFNVYTRVGYAHMGPQSLTKALCVSSKQPTSQVRRRSQIGFTCSRGGRYEGCTENRRENEKEQKLRFWWEREFKCGFVTTDDQTHLRFRRFQSSSAKSQRSNAPSHISQRQDRINPNQGRITLHLRDLCGSTLNSAPQSLAVPYGRDVL